MTAPKPLPPPRVCAFLDDIRTPPEGWVLWRSYDEAVAWMTEHGCPAYVSFDHDLGWYVTAEPSPNDEKSGLDVVRWMIGRDSAGDFIPLDFAFAAHSMNPVGRARILDEMGDHMEWRRLAAAREGKP